MLLSKLRQHSNPASITRPTPSDGKTRLAPAGLMQVVLGCFLEGWGEAGANTIRAAEWLSDLVQTTNSPTTSTSSQQMMDSPNTSNSSQSRRSLTLQQASSSRTRDSLMKSSDGYTSWLGLLVEAAEAYLSSSGTDRIIALERISLGRKTAEKFIGTPSQPMFGLIQKGRYVDLLKTEEDKIEILRKIAEILNNYMRLKPNTVFIRYYHESGGYEYASALPWKSKRTSTHGENREEESAHMRWMFGNGPEFAMNKAYEERKAFYESKGERVVYRDNHSFMPGKFDGPKPAEGQPESLTWNSMLPEGCEPGSPYCFVWGDLTRAGLFILNAFQGIPELLGALDLDCSLFFATVEAGKMDQPKVLDFLSWHFRDRDTEIDPYMKSLRAIATVAKIYQDMPNASIDVRVLHQRLSGAHWIPSELEPASGAEIALMNLSLDPSSLSKVRGRGLPRPLQPFFLSRAQTFACVTMFETGIHNISPDVLDGVLGMSTGNSLFMSSALVSDPAEMRQIHGVRHVKGSIGRDGVGFLVPPDALSFPPSEESDRARFRLEPYDGRLQDYFATTSLSLSFTGNMTILGDPFNFDSSSTQDLDVFLVETRISVYDAGHWIRDLDVFSSLDAPTTLYRMPTCTRRQEHDSANPMAANMAAIKQWVGLTLPLQDTLCVFPAYNNWQARLAATVLSVAGGHETIVMPMPHVCWHCLVEAIDEHYLGKKVVVIA